MPGSKVFIDTNVLLYLLSQDDEKADRAESLIRTGGVISVQVLNELTKVAHRKLGMSWMEVREFIELICTVCEVEAMTLETHDEGRRIAERYMLSVYDSMIVAAAVLTECDTLYSEDMHDGLEIDGLLRICNPF